MTETTLRSITNNGTWMLILVPTYSTKIFIGEPHMSTYVVPFVRRYVTCPRFDRRYPIPSSISLPASLFTRSVIRHHVTNSLVTVLARLLWCCITERAQRYLSDRRNDKSQSRSMPTQQTLSEIPEVHLYDHPVTLWRLMHPTYSYGVRELHDLMVRGTCIWHSERSSNKLNDHVLC